VNVERCALVLLLFAGCNDKPTARSTPKESPSVESAGATPVAQTPKTPATPSKDEVMAAKDDLARFLAAGRKAVKAKDYAAGIDALRKAKALGPLNGKVLGELGWAYFLDGQLDRAAHELDLALRHSTAAKTKGAVLYNLGRVHEARGKVELAAELYAQSLQARPGNAVVEGRLKSLRPGDAPRHTQCAFEPEPTKTPKSVCEDFLTRHRGEGEDPPVCSFGADASSRTAQARAASYEASVFAIHDYELMEESFLLAVVQGEQWSTTRLFSVAHPGVGYADENVDDIALEVRELTGKPPEELVLRWRIGQHDMDPGVLYQEDSTSKSIGVVSLDDGTPRWLATVRTYGEWNRGEMDPDEWGTIIDPQTGSAGAKVTFDDKGSLTVVADGAQLPVSTTAGTFALGEYPVLCPIEQDYFGL
jgi:hypothetical protein